MTPPDFEKMAREWLSSLESAWCANPDCAPCRPTVASLSALLRSVHASRDAEVAAAYERGVRAAAGLADEAFLGTPPRDGKMLSERILALLPKEKP